MVEPYTIHIPDSTLEWTKARLATATLPDELDDAGWSMGTPLIDIRRLAEYWENSFDWRKSEATLNQMPNYRTQIDVDGFGLLDIHFIHQRSSIQNAIPLLFVHGWPGSILEVQKILPLLTKPESEDQVAFHIVAPSLPNHGFSSGVSKRGFGFRQYAETCHKLMLKLGYSQYVTQGGDWGFEITRTIGLLYPESCKASHCNVAECDPPSFFSQPLLWLQHQLTPYTAHERAGLAHTAENQQNGRGYNVMQRTKPQTLAYSLADSPIGLLAWIYEKLHTWTDAYPWTDDEILTWICVYLYSTAGPAASLRLYYEAEDAHTDTAGGGVPYSRLKKWVPHVKYGFAIFPKDTFVHPDLWARTLGRVVHQSRWERGGHFAATECPEAIVKDVRVMFGRRGGAEGVVEGCDGYL